MDGEIRPSQEGGGQDRATTLGQGGDESRLLAGHAGERTHAFEVHGRDGGDDRHVGAEDRRAHAQLARHAHPGLDDRIAMPRRLEPQQHQRDARAGC